MIKSGLIWKYGDDVNTDLIFPGRYTYVLMDETQMGEHALEDLDLQFCKNAVSGDIIVAGKNWGCGSAREQAVKALKARGVAGVIVKGVSRIYYRNALNEGLPVIVCPEAVDALKPGDTAQIDLKENMVITTHGNFTFAKYPPYIQQMVDSGGLVPFVKKQLHEMGKLHESSDE